MTDAKHLIKNHAAQNIPITFEEAYKLGCYLMEGCRGDALAQKQCIAILCALHTKATYLWEKDDQDEKIHGGHLPVNAAEQIAGLCAAIFEHDIGKSEFGFLKPNVPFAMDNCGMGGDLVVTANISTIAAFTAAAAGIPMCKHGSPANADQGRHGSSDFIDLCGINKFPSKAEAEKCIESLGFCYTEALDTRYKLIHLQTHKIAQLPHMNDILGPITNPLDPDKHTRRILGVNHLIPPSIVAQAYVILNKKGVTNLNHGLFIRGFVGNNRTSGIDELSICKEGTQVVELINDEIKEIQLFAGHFGLNPISPEFVSPPTGKSKGEFSLSILKNEAPFPCIQMAASNAALLFYLAKHSTDLKDCYREAEEILTSGKALQRMTAIGQMLPKESN